MSRSESELRRDGSEHPSRGQPAPPRETPDGARIEAQRRVNRIRAFRAELEALAAADVARLTAEQRDEITRYHEALLRELASAHDIDRSEAAGRLSRGMQIAAVLAAVALTAAVYSLVARFWGGMDLPLQVTLLCVFPLAALIGVELAAQRERTLYVASIFAIVAFGTYWLAVAMLSVLLNVPLTPPVLWGGALFGVALALPYGFRVVFGAAIVALLVALSGSVFQAAGMPWTLVPEFPEIITAAAFMLAAVATRLGAGAASFAAVIRGVSLSIGFLGLLMLSTAGPASLLPTSSRVSEFIYQAIMLVATTGILVTAVRRQWIETVYIAAAAMTLFLLTRFVDWFWEALPRFAFFLILAAVAFAWLFALRRLRARLTGAEA